MSARYGGRCEVISRCYRRSLAAPRSGSVDHDDERAGHDARCEDYGYQDPAPLNPSGTAKQREDEVSVTSLSVVPCATR